MNAVAPGATVSAFPPLSVSVRPLPVSPVICPPTVKLFVAHVIATLLTAAPAMVPVAFAIVHVWLGEPGCVPTATAYVAPLATVAGKANVEFSLIVSGAPPFRVRDSESPAASPLTEPPTV